MKKRIMELVEKLNKVRDEVKGIVVGRDEVIDYVVLALLARANLLLYGVPGTSKSLITDNISARVQGATYFTMLMSKGVTKEEIFGRLDIESWKQGTPKLITKNKAPEAHIFFPDEIYKSGERVCNLMLKLAREHTYENEGVVIRTPLMSVISASNEIPDFRLPENSIYKAFHDRFDLKLEVNAIDDESDFLNMLAVGEKAEKAPIVNSIDVKDLEELQEYAENNVTISQDIRKIIYAIVSELRKSGVFVSDRRAVRYHVVVKAHALMNGRDAVTVDDLKVLKNYFWFMPTEVKNVHEVVDNNIVSPYANAILELLTNLSEAHDKAMAYSKEELENMGFMGRTTPYKEFKSSLGLVYKKLMELRKDVSSKADESLLNETLDRAQTFTNEILEKYEFPPMSIEKVLAS